MFYDYHFFESGILFLINFSIFIGKFIEISTTLLYASSAFLCRFQSTHPASAFQIGLTSRRCVPKFLLGMYSRIWPTSSGIFNGFCFLHCSRSIPLLMAIRSETVQPKIVANFSAVYVMLYTVYLYSYLVPTFYSITFFLGIRVIAYLAILLY